MQSSSTAPRLEKHFPDLGESKKVQEALGTWVAVGRRGTPPALLPEIFWELSGLGDKETEVVSSLESGGGKNWPWPRAALRKPWRHEEPQQPGGNCPESSSPVDLMGPGPSSWHLADVT